MVQRGTPKGTISYDRTIHQSNHVGGGYTLLTPVTATPPVTRHSLLFLLFTLYSSTRSQVQLRERPKHSNNVES